MVDKLLENEEAMDGVVETAEADSESIAEKIDEATKEIIEEATDDADAKEDIAEETVEAEMTEEAEELTEETNEEATEDVPEDAEQPVEEPITPETEAVAEEISVAPVAEYEVLAKKEEKKAKKVKNKIPVEEEAYEEDDDVSLFHKSVKWQKIGNRISLALLLLGIAIPLGMLAYIIYVIVSFFI